MTLPNDRFIKLMLKTMGDNDHESLQALRRANAMLVEEKITWTDLLGTVMLTKSATFHHNPPAGFTAWDTVGETAQTGGRVLHRDAGVINELFLKVKCKTMSDTRAAFIESLQVFFTHKQYLTDKQFQSLKRAAEE